ncbi:hypothetical protein SAY87_009933 [Trapa incisa]|uniref:Uncharacterized protein n=1 Tax=Trapa incisa TaxID=236973 RepID=A0AAN7GDV3_9MYRT|nr:hypothetical protein SAY87_009933 [Trapa incisa]
MDSKRVRELTLMPSGDFLRQASSMADRHPESSIDASPKPPLREVDFFSAGSVSRNTFTFDDDGDDPEIKMSNRRSIALSNPRVRLLEAELERLQEENRKVRSMLDHVSRNYSSLQTQFLLAMQKQAHQAHLRDQEIKNSSCLNKTAQHFMDLRPMDGNDPPVSDEKVTLDASVSPTGMEALSKGSNHCITPRKFPRSPIDDHVSETSGPRKAKDDQPEPPFRKARVSVRARSEAPMLPPSPSPPTFPFPLHGNPHLLGLGLGHAKYSADISSHHPKLPSLPGMLPGQQRQPQATLIETVTAAIASDPNFTAALAAAVSTVISAPQGDPDGSNGGNENLSIAGIKPTVLPGSPPPPQSCTAFSTNL